MDRLSCLPNELLFEVYRRCSSVSCVWSLLNTSSRLRSVFDERAKEIVDDVLSSTIPVQTRVRMRIVLALRTRSFSARGYDSIDSTESARWILSETLAASPEQLQQFVRVAHQIHVMAHLCIAECVENCLASPISPKEVPLGFEDPSWTEENRVVMGFWHVWCLNELKTAAREGHLRWSAEDVALVQRARAYTFPAYPNSIYQAITASRWLWRQANPDRSEVDFWPDSTSDILPLPRLDRNVQFGWNCQNPSCPTAIEQDRVELVEYHHPTPRPRPVEVHRTAIKQDSVDSIECHPPTPRPRAVKLHQTEPLIWASDSSDDEEEFHSDSQPEEEASEDGDSESEESDSEATDTESAQSESTQASPVLSVPVVNRRPPQIEAPIRQFHWYALRSKRPPEHGKLAEEWQDLDARTLGWQIWWNMSADPNAGDAQHMEFNGFIKYGFAIWEERRLIDLGLWNNDAWDNPTRFYWRCYYGLLSDEDILRHNFLYQTYDDDSDADSLSRDWAAARRIYRRIGRRDLR